jgi:hypothetical protein
VAAVREVALLLIAQHLEMAARSRRKDAVEEMRAVLQLALAHPHASPAPFPEARVSVDESTSPGIEGALQRKVGLGSEIRKARE